MEAVTDEALVVVLSADEFDFLTTYDPERERSATRRDLVAFIEHMQLALREGLQ